MARLSLAAWLPPVSGPDRKRISPSGGHPGLRPGTSPERLRDEGDGFVDNRQVDNVSIINSKNQAVTISIDRINHLPVKKIFIIRDPQTRDRDEIDEVYDNWKKIDGINTPYNTLVTYNGELYRQYYVNTITFNSHLQDSLFATPKLDFNRKKK